MSGNWLDLSSTSNRYIQTYVKGFVDISGGNLLVNNAGRIGVGTRTPTCALDVSGDLSVSGLLTVKQYRATSTISTTTTNYNLVVTEDISLNGTLNTSGSLNVGGAINGITIMKHIQSSSGVYYYNIGTLLKDNGSARQTNISGVVGNINCWPTDNCHFNLNFGTNGSAKDSIYSSIIFNGAKPTEIQLLVYGTGPWTFYLKGRDWFNFSLLINCPDGVNGFVSNPNWKSSESATAPSGTATYDLFNRNYQVLTTSGNLGIGTTTPTYTLDVSGSTRVISGTANSFAELRIMNPTNSNTNYGTALMFDNWNSLGYTEAMGNIKCARANNAANYTTYMSFSNNGSTERMRIDSNGYVGIGTTTPTAPLHVAGRALIYGGASINVDVNNTSQNFDTGALLTISSEGNNLGGTIGNYLPRLTLKSGNANLSYLNIYDYRYATGTGWESASTRIQSRIDVTNGAYIEFNPPGNGHGIGFYAGSSTTLQSMSPRGITINASGNVGIGTTAPALPLSVTANSAGTGTATVTQYLGDFRFSPTAPTTGTKLGAGIRLLASTGAGGINNYGGEVVGFAHVGTTHGLMFNTYNGSDANLTTVMTISSGNVGIGTTTPAQLLDISTETGSANIRIRSQFSAGYITSGYNSGVNSYIGIKSGANTTDTLGTPPFVVTNDSRVGIGTTTPNVPLHVASTGAISTGNYANGGYLNGVGAVGFGGVNNGTSMYSIHCNGRVSATEFNAYSDYRIKREIKDIDDGNALSVLRLLKPKTYKYIDNIQNKSSLVYGFIAQEVKEVLDYTVDTHIEYIPNIYEKATSVIGNKIVLNNKSTESFIIDASNTEVKILLYDDSNNRIETKLVSIIDDKTFEISDELDLLEIFVYGQEVNDFQSLEKNSIYTIATAALQQIDREYQVTKQEVEDLKQENASLKTRLSAIEARLSAAGIP